MRVHDETPNDKPTALVEFTNVSKSFGSMVAVSGLDLTIHKGEFLAIMGPSGCGKTTTLRMLAGLEDVSGGDLRIEGVSTLDLAPHQRDTPLVWQSLALFPFMTVQQNVEFGLKMRRVPRRVREVRVARWLERLEIGDLAKRNVDTLSGGQRQRVALARSLVIEPKMLLLDEPLSALYASLVLRMQSVLTNLQKDLGITFVYVTHNQSEAFAMADRVVIMNEGKICQIGSPKEIYRQPATRFVAEFVGLNNILSGTVLDKTAYQIIVDTRSGQFAIDGKPDCEFGAGDEITFIVAADSLKPISTEAAPHNGMFCTVISEEFIGSTVVVLLEQVTGEERKIQLAQRDFETAGLMPGRKVILSFASSEAHILPRASQETH